MRPHTNFRKGSFYLRCLLTGLTFIKGATLSILLVIFSGVLYWCNYHFFMVVALSDLLYMYDIETLHGLCLLLTASENLF